MPLTAQELLSYAQTALLDPQSLSLELCQKALTSANDIVGKRSATKTQMQDIAFFRLCLALKMEIPEIFKSLYDEALKEIGVARRIAIGQER